MTKVKTYNLKDKKIDEVKVSEKIFKIEVEKELVHFVLMCYLHNKREKTAKVKTRTEVAGGGRKPWKQKGTGRARSGSIRSPLWVGGGVTFGPQNIKRELKVNKKVQRKVLFGVLSDKVNNTIILKHEEAIGKELSKVKDFNGILTDLDIADQKILYVSKEKKARETWLGNLKNVKVQSVFGLNPFDILNANQIMFEESSIKQLEEIYSKNG